MRNLIIYYSFTGNNEKLAAYLQEKLNADLARIETLRPRTGLSIFLDIVFKRRPAVKTIPYDLTRYEHVILVAPVWAGAVAAPMTTFMMQAKSSIAHYSFITLCGGAPRQKEKLQVRLHEIVGKDPLYLIELSIADLLSSGQAASHKGVTTFRIKTTELNHFENQLRNFVKEENLFNAI